jgi:hypothetical protein
MARRDGAKARRRKVDGVGQDRRKPRLLVDNANPDLTVAALRDILSRAERLYDRGAPVRLAIDRTGRGGSSAQVLAPDDLVLLAHQVARPYAEQPDGDETNVPLPKSIARMYLGWKGEWQLPPLNGIASAPLLSEDGGFSSSSGYDAATGMWQENVPDLRDLVPERPTGAEAEAALRLIRRTFRTFCFADAATAFDPLEGVPVVDVNEPPGRDESGFLVALLTAVCRPSLPLAPGVLFRAPAISGAGTGKGLLARCISLIGFGREPHAVTSGAKAEELEKRIAAELMQGHPVLFLDNLNNTAFRSNLLASAITERPSRVRLLGHSRMLQLNASAFVVLTGNGLNVSEDLARRFISVDFDAGVEDPESRAFKEDIKKYVADRRGELLAATLTIWRWGRQTKELTKGRPLGSFEVWGRWVRDPLLALGCADPVDRVGDAKWLDARRQEIADLFAVWWERHADRAVTLRTLHEDARMAVDPHNRGRQYLASRLGRLAGTRLGGFRLTRRKAGGRWGAATFALLREIDADVS